MIIGIGAGFAAGAAAVLIWFLVRQGSQRARASVVESRLADTQSALAQATLQAESAAAAAGAAETARAVLAAELAVVRGVEADREVRAEQERERLAGAFAELSAEALQRNNEQFLALADTRLNQAQAAAQGDLSQRHQAIAQLLGPLSETLVRYEEELRQMELDRKGAYASLHEKVTQLQEGNSQLQKETRGLVTALRSPQTRGRWGEIQLRRVVEMAGMLEHCDFDEQVSAPGEHGRLRPDLVVRMPGGRQMVVDAKVPLDAYLKLIESDDEVERSVHQLAHARQLRTHVDQLAKKEYWKQFARSPEQVVAFIPGDQLLSAAYESDPGLQEYAWANGVLLTTPTMLIALLRSIAFGWRQEVLADNAREVQKLGAEMYDRLRTMSTHLQRLQRSLTASVTAYNDAVGSLESRVLVSARRFPTLGVIGDGDEIPDLVPVQAAARHLQAIELVTDHPDDVEPRALPEGNAASS
jgi:DNA recombination protein RmuC